MLHNTTLSAIWKKWQATRTRRLPHTLRLMFWPITDVHEGVKNISQTAGASAMSWRLREACLLTAYLLSFSPRATKTSSSTCLSADYQLISAHRNTSKQLAHTTITTMPPTSHNRTDILASNIVETRAEEMNLRGSKQSSNVMLPSSHPSLISPTVSPHASSSGSSCAIASLVHTMLHSWCTPQQSAQIRRDANGSSLGSYPQEPTSEVTTQQSAQNPTRCKGLKPRLLPHGSSGTSL